MLKLLPGQNSTVVGRPTFVYCPGCAEDIIIIIIIYLLSKHISNDSCSNVTIFLLPQCIVGAYVGKACRLQ